MLSLQEALTLASVVLIMCGSTARSQLEIQAFQPAVVPIRAITTLTLKTNVKLNVTSHTTLQCRFKDISVPAKMEDGFIFCDTPPIKNTDRVPLHLDIDGKLFKTKKPLYFHEPFKVSNVTPSVVSPAQNVHLTVSGISCKEWIQYFVKFQTANGTKKTQQGICKDSVVSCYVPEFPPNTRLRVGVTLSNRLVEWADTKIIIQYPIDAIRSTVKDINTDTTRKGAFTFFVVLKDRFKNPIKIINKKHARISVQYSSRDKPQSLRFLQCTTTLRNSREGDEYLLNCAGAEKENIFFYPSINNVPLGGQDRYEAKTTLCPGKNSCKAEPKSFVLVIVLSSVGIALLLLLVAVLIFVRYQAAKKTRVAPERTSELEMEIHRPKNEDRMVLYEVENSALETSDEEERASSPAQDNVMDDTGLVGDSLLGVSGVHQESERGHQTEVLEEVENLEQQTSGNEAKEIVMKDHQIDTELSAAKDSKESAPSSPSSQTDLTDAFLGDESLAATAGSSDVESVEPTAFTNDAARASSCGGQFIDSDSLLGVSGAHQESERGRQTEVLEEVENLTQQTSGNEGESDEQSAKGIIMKDHQIDTELSAAKDSKESAPSSPSSQTDLTDAFLGDESLAATAGSSDVEDVERTAFTNDACASSCGGQFIDRAQKQSAKRRKSRLDNNRVRPAECESTTLGQIKYTERFKKADEYRQAWINNILGGDEPPENKSDT